MRGNRTGIDAGDFDAVVAEFFKEGFAHTADGEFCGIIARYVWISHKAGDRGNVENVRMCGFSFHEGHDGSREVVDAVDIGVDHGFPVVGGDFIDGAKDAEPCVVDEDVGSVLIGECGGDPGIEGFAFAHVGDDGVVGVSKFFADAVVGGWVATEAVYDCTGSDEVFGEGGSDPAGGSGDDGNFIGKIHRGVGLGLISCVFVLIVIGERYEFWLAIGRVGRCFPSRNPGKKVPESV